MEDLLLVQFSKDGNGPDFYNCWNYCREVAKRANRVMPAFSDWIEELSIRDNVFHRFLKSDFVHLSKPQPFCIVTIKLVYKYINHCGIVLEDGIHFTQIQDVGPSIERLDDFKWLKRIEGFYQYVEHNKSKQSIQTL